MFMKESSINPVDIIKVNIKKLNNCSYDELKEIVLRLHRVVSDHEGTKSELYYLINQLSDKVDILEERLSSMKELEGRIINLIEWLLEIDREQRLAIVNLYDRVEVSGKSLNSK